jgi:hypothetical protein
LAENVFSGAHKDDILYLLSAQEISKYQQKDRELMKKLRDKPGYSDTVLEGTDLITYHDRIYISHALQEHIVEGYHSMLGHPGEKHTVATMTQHLIWPKIHEQVATHVSEITETGGTITEMPQITKNSIEKSLVLPKLSKYCLNLPNFKKIQ